MSNLLRSISNIVVALILVAVATTMTYARWLQPGESDLIFDYMNVDIIVNNDESSAIEEWQATIVTDKGKDEAIAWRNYYNPSYQTLEVLDAYTIIGKKKYKVPNKFIEDKMSYSCGTGFDRIHCLTIAFPKAEVGAKIYLKLRLNSRHPVNNHFSEVRGFTGYEYKKYSYSINSSMPIYVNINDPNNKLELVQTKKTKSGRYLTKVKLTKPIAAAIRNEPHYSVLNEHSETMFSISTDSSWEDIGKKLTKDYFTVIDQPLPAELKVIVDDAKKYTNSVEQINFVTAKLQNALSSIGYTVCPINGKFIPRDLIRIVDIGVADSKDFVVATAAILKQLQYEVSPVLVANPGPQNISQVKLPNMIGINNTHKLGYAALKVIDSNGQVYWLDSSNGVSAANSIPVNIHDRMVLVLSPHGATYEKVPEIAPEYSQVIMNTVVTQKSNRSVNYNGNVILKGHSAAMLTGMALYNSPGIVKESIFSFISREGLDNHNKKNIVIPDLTSRIVQDYNIEYEYEDNHNTLITNLGYGLPLARSIACEIIASAIPDQVGDLYLEVPSTAYRRTVIKDEVLKLIDKLNYKIDTPWIYIEQSCRQVGNDSEIVFKHIVRKPIISNLELQSPTYKKLKKDVECFVNNAYVILSEK